jgi:uncharacterized protein YndB with AHSA1/START domain
MTPATKKRWVKLERTFQAPVEDVWALWTTKEGIESWWGPDGFRVTVHAIDLRAGGLLLYAMTAVDPEQIRAVEQAGMPVSNECRLTFTEVTPLRRLAYLHLVDFVPGVEAYELPHAVDISEGPNGVTMVLSFEAMHDDHWTHLATTGWENELDKLGKALATRA